MPNFIRNTTSEGVVIGIEPAIPSSGISRWTFDTSDTSSGTAIDIWGSNNGSINGATTGASGANQTYTTNEAYSFDGANDYVNLQKTMPSNPDTSYSFALWVKTSASNRGVIFGQRDTNNTGSELSIEYRADKSNQVRASEFSDLPTIAKCDSSTDISDGSWYHVVYTRDAPNSATELYIDGVSEDTGSTRPLDHDDAYWIGARGGSGGNDRYLDCDIDDVRIYDKELSSTEVSDLYNYGTINPVILTWETTTDWDNASSESGVSHESITGTDHDDATTIIQGESFSSPTVTDNLEQFLPCQDDGTFSDGDPIVDVSGNNNNGEVEQSPTEESGGLAGGSRIACDGSDDGILDNGVYVPQSTPWTISMWVVTPSTSGIIFRQGQSGVFSYNQNGNNKFKLSTFGSNTGSIGNSVSNQTIHHVAISQDSSKNVQLWQNGSPTASQSYGDTFDNSSNPIGFGGDPNDNVYSDAKFLSIRQYSDQLTDSEVQTLYDLYATTGFITSSTKFTKPLKPDLQNLSYTLNSQSITLDVIGSPGTTSEEVVSQTLNGSPSYSLSWSNGHNNFQVKAKLSNSDVTKTATLDSVTLR
jgi:hypothetical protein